MDSIVIELQREALNREVKVSDLLRKALIISKKLHLYEFGTWIEKELNGYKEDDNVPDYRAISGEVRGWNPYNGWIPLIFQDPKIGELVTSRKTNQPIAQLEELESKKSNDSALHMPLPQALQRKLSKGFGYETQVSLFADRSSLIKITDTVRNIILNWTLKLEDDGILGEGLSFTNQEKESAVNSPQNINYFFGSVENSQIQQGTLESKQEITMSYSDPAALLSLIELIKNKMEATDIDSTTKKEVEAEIGTLESQYASPKPKNNIIKESLISLRRIFEGASGSAAAQILIELGKFLTG